MQRLVSTLLAKEDARAIMTSVDETVSALEDAAASIKKLKGMEHSMDMKTTLDDLVRRFDAVTEFLSLEASKNQRNHDALMDTMKTITNETMKSSATATANAKSMRQLLMMQTHANIVATLPQASHGSCSQASMEKAEDLLKLYGYKNPAKDKNGIEINTDQRDLNARRALFYLTSGYVYGDTTSAKSYRNLEV